uniref:Uncharacterized protein n=1 Tax=Anguilla anguilla TaxID=7936 RepID=A0A0E9XTY5_ANGAN
MKQVLLTLSLLCPTFDSCCNLCLLERQFFACMLFCIFTGECKYLLYFC